MSRAGLNTWTHDIYSGIGTAGGMGGFVYLRDSAFAGHNPDSECASCHQPESWIENPFSALVDPTAATPGVTHGVSCEVCHKVADVDESKLNFPGIYPGAVTFTRPEGPDYDQVQYGVLGDVSFVDQPAMRSSHQPQLVAEVCATCHQDKNDPDEDGDFEEANGVISEPTYFEWKNSPWADSSSPGYATCVDCHMPPSGETGVCDELVPPLIRDPATIRSHNIRGTTAEYLENAVELSLDTRIAGDAIEVDVAVTNSFTGHHVPTGVTVRNMILLVEAERISDSLALTHSGTQTVHDLGGVGDPEQGYYAGLPGKFFAKVNHDASGNGPTFFTDAVGIQFDNRIPAMATDNSSYTFDVPVGGGELRVSARLIYRRAFRFLVDAKQWSEDGQGNPLADVAPPYFGHLMESATRTIVAVPCDGEPLGASCSDSNPCNGEETCDGAGSCTAGTPLVCDDGLECTDDSCDPEGGCVFSNNVAPCDDTDVCTVDDSCSAGVCVGIPLAGCGVTTTTSTTTTTVPACQDSLRMENCWAKPLFDGASSDSDRLLASCKVLDATAAIGGIDPSMEQLLFTLDPSGGSCFTAALELADCVGTPTGAFKCKPTEDAVPHVRVRLSPLKRRPGSYRLKLRARDADLQCLDGVSPPWTMGLGVGDDCGLVACQGAGRRVECPGP